MQVYTVNKKAKVEEPHIKHISKQGGLVQLLLTNLKQADRNIYILQHPIFVLTK